MQAEFCLGAASSAQRRVGENVRLCYGATVNRRHCYLVLRFLIGAVWFINGLVCKVLGLVPRHLEIVGRMLGEEHAVAITRAIGLGEVALALAIWCGLWPRWLAATQVALVLAMNVMEFFLAPDLLLWGKMNSVYALIFAAVVFVNEWLINPKGEADH